MVDDDGENRARILDSEFATMQESSFVDFKYLKGRPCSFPFVYEGLVGSPSGSMSRKDNLILLAQSFYLLGLNPDDR